jgi:hypothetical protein
MERRASAGRDESQPVAAQMPRNVRRGPPITVKCECGQQRELRYGERWRCDGCGRNYDTNRIPADEYASFHRNRVRDRFLPGAVFLALGGAVLAFVLTGYPFGAILIVGAVGFMWGTFVRPVRRRRQYRAIADRPSWKIKSD